MKQNVALAIASLAVLAACSDSPAPTQSVAAPSAAAAFAAAVGPEYVPGEVIVKFRANASAANRGAAMRAANLSRTTCRSAGARREGSDLTSPKDRTEWRTSATLTPYCAAISVKRLAV